MEPITEHREIAGAQLVRRHFTEPDADPFETVEWDVRDAWPNDPRYHNPGILVPKSWSQNALDIVSKLYLARSPDYSERSIKDLIERVVSKYAVEAMMRGYFGDDPRAFEEPAIDGPITRVEWVKSFPSDHPVNIFYDELCYILLHQMAAFNSPVWFNVGRPDRKQQVSACFILSVDDNTTSIMKTATREAFIFKGGSGSGFDVSRIRGSEEALSTGGTASGPVSFMRMWDAGAGTFKSGGMTRRAAKLVKCDVDHPDIGDFIDCKRREEERLRVLAKAGFNISMDTEGEKFVAEVTSFQNANLSAGVTDEFMRKALGVDEDPCWPLIARKTGEKIIVDKAPGILDDIADAAWRCADPGMLFMDAINRMHTTPILDGEPSPIRSSNPCGEYLSNDDTSCNLASINVLKFVGPNANFAVLKGFDVEGYRQVVDVMILAMDVSVSFADFPDEIIADRSRKMRQLGLGFSNMGAVIMSQGMAYDSDDARDFAASVMALTTGRAYHQSARIAGKIGPFHYFEENRAAMADVIGHHLASLPEPDGIREMPSPIWAAARKDWERGSDEGSRHGYSNAQATVLAPAGTISFLMDCDTTGIEPAFELVAHKTLAGGGSMVLENSCVRAGIYATGNECDGADLVDLLREQGSEAFLAALPPESRVVFHGANEISAEGHIKMLAAVQPFVSGGISKTINMPESASVEDVRSAYALAWALGVKDLALYRNNSKIRQVLAAPPPKIKVAESSEDSLDQAESALGRIIEKVWTPDFLKNAGLEDIERGGETDKFEPLYLPQPQRRRMSRTRKALIHKIQVHSAMSEHEGYVQAGMYEDGTLGEIFIEGFGKQGSFTQNALAAWATDFSICLQYGVPLDVLCRKHAFVSDETGGMVVPPTDGTKLVITRCNSIVDYIARWLVAEFGDDDLAEELGVMTDAVKARKTVVTMGVDFGAGQESAAVFTSAEGLADAGTKSNLRASFKVVPEDHVSEFGVIREGTVAEVPKPWIEGLNGHARGTDMGIPCTQCGATMQRAGACWACKTCGATTGCG